MATIAALVPPVIACAAFIAIAVFVKRFNDREERQDRADRE
jgi:hypothetical protein